MRGGRLAIALVSIAGLAAGPVAFGLTRGSSAANAHRPRATASVPARHAAVSASVARIRPAHVAVIVMENESYASVVGSGAAPFITRLARRYAIAQAAYAVDHPSLPNYLALTGGSTFGINSDCTDCSVHAASLVSQLEAAGISWKAYMENLPRPCYAGSGSGDYVKKHDPFMYYTDIAHNPSRCSRVVPLMQLSADERNAALPRFVWITPDLCHDMHDCSVSTGDRFLARVVPPLLRALGTHGILFLTWDEGSSDNGCCRAASGGRVATIAAGPGARRATRMQTPSDHYSLLQTIEDLFALPHLRYAACACTPTLAPLLIGS